jgi:hypothetical protein
MAAAKFNNYWEFRGKHGAPFSYDKDSLWKEALEYFDWMKDRKWNKQEAIKSGDMAGTTMDVPTSTPFSIKTFCIFADITYQTFLNYCSNEDPWKDLFEVSTRIKEIIESQQFEGATVGAYNPNIIARTLGLVDKKEVENKGDITIIVDNKDAKLGS